MSHVPIYVGGSRHGTARLLYIHGLTNPRWIDSEYQGFRRMNHKQGDASLNRAISRMLIKLDRRPSHTGQDMHMNAHVAYVKLISNAFVLNHMKAGRNGLVLSIDPLSNFNAIKRFAQNTSRSQALLLAMFFVCVLNNRPLWELCDVVKYLVYLLTMLI